MSKLRGDQIVGRDFLMEHSKAILADDVGFGKTPPTLEAIRELSLHRVLYITGAMPAYQVETEASIWAPGLSARVVRGARRFRHTIYSQPPNITILGYESFRSDSEVLAKLHWDLLVLDDASHFKTPDSNLTVAGNLVSRSSDRVWALTATPLETSLLDVWSIFHATNLYPIGSLEHFYARYCVFSVRRFRDRPPHREITSYVNLEEFMERIKPYVLRRINVDGPKLSIIDFPMGMYPEQARLYELARRGQFGYSIYDRFQRCLQYCDSSIFSGSQVAVSSKIDLLVQVLQTLPPGTKVLIYSMWKAVLHHLESVLDSFSIRWVEISGDVPIPVRNDNQQSFLKDPTIQVCCVTKAGEQALNLQAAQFIICINRLANPQRMQQVFGRIKRTGSPFAEVYAINLYIEQSVEERMIALQHERADLFTTIFGDEAVLRRLSASEMAEALQLDVELPRTPSVSSTRPNFIERVITRQLEEPLQYLMRRT